MTGCARVPSPASSGWKSVPRKNGVVGELQRARRAVLVVGAEDDGGGFERGDVALGDPVRAVVALEGALGTGDARDQRPRRVADRALVADQRARQLHDDVGAVALILR